MFKRMFDNLKQTPEQSIMPIMATWITVRQYYLSSINQRFKDQDKKIDILSASIDQRFKEQDIKIDKMKAEIKQEIQTEFLKIQAQLINITNMQVENKTELAKQGEQIKCLQKH